MNMNFYVIYVKFSMCNVALHTFNVDVNVKKKYFLQFQQKYSE